MIASHKVYQSELEHVQFVYNDTIARKYIAGTDFHAYWLHREDDAKLNAWNSWHDTLPILNMNGETDYDNQFWKLTDQDKYDHISQTGEVLHKVI
ncbi:MAG: hypothetical protein HC906_10770 [Bacteroidales bacterium]|nr:hypothetical protein [Bacteroidales bacterium]